MLEFASLLYNFAVNYFEAKPLSVTLVYSNHH